MEMVKMDELPNEVCGDAFLGTVGERIRYFRHRKKMTQKQLAKLCHITEPAIRNYELGNRIPGYSTINDIAEALEVSYYSIVEPSYAETLSAIHYLFTLEYAYNLRPVEVNGNAILAIERFPGETETPVFQMMMNAWMQARKKYDSGEWTLEEYHDWMFEYPKPVSVSLTLKNGNKSEDIKVNMVLKKKRPRKNQTKK